MKTQTTHLYDFQQDSRSNEPGFVVFKSDTSAVWYFQGNDMTGQASMFSAGYSSQEKAKAGLASALEAFRKNRMRIEESARGWELVLKAGNHQEIARSRPFPDRSSAEKQARFFQQVSASAHPEVRPAPVVPVAEPQPMDSPATLNPFRYAFRIHFYPNEKEAALSGRIENIKTGKQHSFKGLDISSITRFLQTEVKEFANQSLAPAGAAAEGIVQVRSKVRAARNPAGKAAVELLMDLQTETGLPGEGSVEACTISLRNMESQRTDTLYPKNTQQVQAGQLHLMLEPAELPAGMYYMHASVWLQTATGGSPRRLQSTGWFQVV